MTGVFETLSSVPRRPALPMPALARWQPLRLGLVELFHYDSEEFWFRDGHLLLRGNNGTGKSKVLALTLPFLLDAQLRPSRIEPDGDSGKKMAWNLLIGSYERRIGYAWIEFGRLAEDGTPHYLTLGAGLSAAAARTQVDSWFFVLEGGGHAGPRIGQDLWLTNAQGVVLTRERLREAIEGQGQMFETATSYRRAVDERLFHLGQKRYDALMDTLIQLRQPQLSRNPDEAGLSNALTEALPPLPAELLGDVAEALNQLEEDRRQLEEYRELAQAVARFDQRYRIYAGTQSRRQARGVRQAQTDFDNASRERNEALGRTQDAQEKEAGARSVHDEAELALAGQRTRLETLQSDPAMQDANRLAIAEHDAAARQRAVEGARSARDEADKRLRRSSLSTAEYADRVTRAERALTDVRQESAGFAETAGIASPYGSNPLATLVGAALEDITPRAFNTAELELRALVGARRDQLDLVRRHHTAVARAEDLHAQTQRVQNEKQDDADAATQRRAQADADVERESRTLVEAWDAHFAGLRQLQLTAEAPLAALADWVGGIAGDNPAQQALHAAQQQASLRLAASRVELDDRQQAQQEEQRTLDAERHGLEAGVDTVPPLPYTRSQDARDGRTGAPLWQLIDFREQVDAPRRAGLEAALEAAGLLDAWVTPDGLLQKADGTRVPDTQVLQRPIPQTRSLAAWLQTAIPPDSAVPASTVERLLASMACEEDEAVDAETWITPDGRFRLGTLAGTWTKPAAVYIGFAARADARQRRLAEIDQRLAQLAIEQAELQAQFNLHAAAQQQAELEWRGAPSDQTLRQAHLAAAACAREFQSAREKLVQAEALCSEAEQALQAARQTLARDAADLRLPEAADALPAIEDALDGFNDSQYRLVPSAQEWRRAVPELRQQQARESEAREDLRQREEQLAASRIETEEAQSRLTVLREAVGARVEELQKRLADARKTVVESESALKKAADALRKAGEGRAIAQQQAATAEDALAQRTEARMQTVARLQQFAATGLLLAALPDAEVPDLRTPWTIDPALTLARRTEQALAEVKDDDDTWARVQRQIAEDLQELQRSLSALGHHAPAEPSDWGLIVHIIYQNRPERPDQLAVQLTDEIAQRNELLTANERAVLENHLQAEIAAEVQRLLQGAEKQVDAINKELHKRPTSTGVRYRLQWQPLAEDEGAPIGLDTARRRLLNTSADLWSAEDRRVVGAMLQQRIAAERERSDLALGRDSGGGLLDQLARALDYRRWHRFRIERWQDGHWRKLSGPASSGERALGLTVPLFAAVASFYSQSSYAFAPRLMLLDEAFAGIDDAARAHCMGLIREFDLDFVITSEREWGCYAELPGVAICQLQRREGIDAVFVSRWTWDGRAKTREADPDRRFALS